MIVAGNAIWSQSRLKAIRSINLSKSSVLAARQSQIRTLQTGGRDGQVVHEQHRGAVEEGCPRGSACAKYPSPHPPVTVPRIEQRHITWEAPHPGTSGVCLFYRALEEELWKRSPVVFL